MLKGMTTRRHIFKDLVRAHIHTLRVDKKYKPAPSDPVYIRDQLPLDSLVVSNARKRANSHTTGDTTPPDKESKPLDASRKRVASQTANFWRISNTQALLGRYDHAHWDEMEQFIQFLPQEHKAKAQDLVREGQLISNNQIRCSLDAADTSARPVNTSVLLRRHAWLRISGFKPEVQTSILNTPFDKEHLFGPVVDSSLKKMKKDAEVAKSMGALQSPQGRGSFWHSFYCAGSKNTSSDTAST